ncbi:MAG: hypothetical protein IJ491_09895 [Clostridia bacterium]|nr:hypothetical protein [Clostridia bacterium]
MKKSKKLISLILSIVMIFSLASICASAEGTQEAAPTLDTSAFKTDYPYIFVHGMGGWAPGSDYYSVSPYWGGGLLPGSTDDIIKTLNEQGVEAYAPAVGPLSSAWDRACELYAQLMGTVVDYGAAHAEAHGHDRYGFNYEGKAIMGESWDMTEKINLVGHSFGGATVRLFTSLMAYGCEEEVAATGSDTSALFVGGHDSVHSCITLSAPHNGSQVANLLFDPGVTMLAISAALNMVGAFFGNDFMVFSLQLGHFGITPKQGEDKAKIDLKAIKNFYKANDNCGYDMTLRGAAELNETIKLAENTYYYSYTTATTEEGPFGKQTPMDSLNPIFYISSAMIGMTEGTTIDGIKIEGDWAVNDGIVPLASALYPTVDAATATDYEDAIANGEEITSGRWYYTDTMVGMDHFDFCGTEDYPTSFEQFYFDMVALANSR